MPLTNPIGIANLKKIGEIVEKATLNLKGYVKQDWPAVTHFLITSVELAAREIDKSDLLGPEKKATVLQSISELYDLTVPNLLPFYIRPFNTQIKNFLVNVVLNVFIDYIVSKIHLLSQGQEVKK